MYPILQNENRLLKEEINSKFQIITQQIQTLNQNLIALFNGKSPKYEISGDTISNNISNSNQMTSTSNFNQELNYQSQQSEDYFDMPLFTDFDQGVLNVLIFLVIVIFPAIIFSPLAQNNIKNQQMVGITPLTLINPQSVQLETTVMPFKVEQGSQTTNESPLELLSLCKNIDIENVCKKYNQGNVE